MKIAFVWDNFGPMHSDRCDAVATSMGSQTEVVGLELFANSHEYAWESESGTRFRKVTFYESRDWNRVSQFQLARALVKECIVAGITHVFLCNYDKMGIFIAAVLLRLAGKKVYVMGCSKFDDHKRSVWREAIKRYVFLAPYQGAIASGHRSRDYMRFLGIPEHKIFNEYNTLSIDRIRQLAGAPVAPKGLDFDQRHFTIVARFVPKKNLLMALDAYKRYLDASKSSCRKLHLCGSGELEEHLVRRVEELDLQDHVEFRGFLQTDKVAQVLSSTLALILPSVEEQFGNVVIEAQAMGIPVILSDVCGARDNLIRNAVNGFVFEPDNPEGLAYFMGHLAENRTLWARLCTQASKSAEIGDVRSFAVAVNNMVRA